MGQSAAQHMEDFACSWHWVAAIRGKGPAPKNTKSIAVTTLEKIFMPVYLDCLFLSCLVCDLNHRVKHFQFKTSIAFDPAKCSVIAGCSFPSRSSCVGSAICRVSSTCKPSSLLSFRPSSLVWSLFSTSRNPWWTAVMFAKADWRGDRTWRDTTARTSCLTEQPWMYWQPWLGLR